MFSGIIETLAPILAVDGSKFTVANTLWDDLHVWQSIAHDGACMTIESIDDDSYSFFVMQESFNTTNFATKSAWDSFNVERCVRVWDRIDGHFVSGHIDTTGTVLEVVSQDDDSLIVSIEFDLRFSRYTIPKGSVAINGTSLTIVENRDGYLSVSLIPLTQKLTNLWKLKPRDIVNLEFDMLGKYILNS